MTIPVTKSPLKAGEGKTIYWTYEELVRLDDALCCYLYQDSGKVPEIAKLVKHMIDKVNRHI